MGGARPGRSPRRSGNRTAGAERPLFRVYLGLVLTMVFWGSAFVTSKMLVFEVPPDVGAVLRFGFGSLLMMAVLVRRAARPVPPREARGRLVLIGLVGVTAFNLCFFRGLALAPASDAGMIIPTMSPVFTAAAGMLFLGEPARLNRIGGLCASLFGAVLFFWEAVAHPAGGAARIHGDLFVLGAAACWAAASILSRPLLERIGALPAAAWSLLIGSAVLLLVALPKLPAVPWGRLSPAFWGVLAYLVVFPTVIAYVLGFEGIRRIGSGPATSFMFLAPVSALLLSAAILGERPTPLQGAGGAAMLLGVWWINRR